MLIGRDVIEAMIAHAHRDKPNECCGLLVGRPGRIDESVPATNLAASPTRFHVDPADHIAVNRRLRGSGREVVGVYHSHPRSAAEPSPTDIDEAHYPEFVHVIVSLEDPLRPDIRGYRISNGRAAAVALEPDSYLPCHPPSTKND